MTKCLIVDDLKDNLYMLQVVLESQGYEVISAENGQVALEYALNSMPDIIVSDILMPVMDGFNLCKEWKKNPELAKIPFIFYTATYTDEKDKDFALSLGADLFLIKPLEPATLLKHINHFLELYQSGNFKPSLSNKIEDNNQEFTSEYNETLIRKLEKKMFQLEHEINEKIKVEEELRVSEERFKLATKSGLVGVWDWDLEKNSIYIEPYLKSMLGYKDNEIPNTIEFWNKFIHPEDKDLLTDMINDCVSGKIENIDSTHRVLHKNGQYRWFQRQGHVLKNNNGLPVRMVGITMDITNQVKSREEVNMLAHALKAVKEFVCITDNKGYINYINDSLINTLGYEKEEIMGSSIENILNKKSDPDILQAFDFSLLKADFQMETTVMNKNGIKIPVLLAVSPTEDNSLITWIISNLTEIKEKEKQLRFSQKMETIGTMVSGIAHDFNNILLAINGNTELAIIKTPDSSPAKKYMNSVLQASSRAKNLINQLLTISRGQESELKPIDVFPIMKEVEKLMRATIPSTLLINSEINCNQTYILADAIQIHQVLINLCTNAFHSMEESGGILKIVADNVLLSEKDTDFNEPVMAGNYLRIVVSDTGTGLDPKIIHKIFEPFFTTKIPGRGTGLGLSVVHGIVKRHKGFIKVESEPGKGSQFSVLFPLCKEKHCKEPDFIDSIVKGSECILCVDDEKVLTEMLEEILKELGYKILVCNNSLEAVDLFNQNKNDIDLILTDLTMPHLTGLELANEISKIKKDIPIILCSGNKEKVTNKTLAENNIKTMISKPFSIYELSRTIRNALDNE